MRNLKVILITLAIVISATVARAGDIREVISTSPSWNTFTNRDGSGLYHEILREVFALHGVTVRHYYSTSGRSEELVAQKQADMMTCDDKPSHSLVMGRYPMYESPFYVFFEKERFWPWQGMESLRGREILSQPTYYSTANFPVPVTIREVPTGVQALGMILLGRSDFYVDDITLIKQSIGQNTIEFDTDQYAIKKAGSRSYHPLFNKTERGEAIRAMYEEGMRTLHESGKLRPIYEKWNHPYPDFDKY